MAKNIRVSRETFKVTAQVFRDIKPADENVTPWMAWMDLVDGVANVFEEGSEKFDKDRWLASCGVG